VVVSEPVTERVILQFTHGVTFERFDTVYVPSPVNV
jgi:hypothetical protein